MVGGQQHPSAGADQRREAAVDQPEGVRPVAPEQVEQQLGVARRAGAGGTEDGAEVAAVVDLPREHDGGVGVVREGVVGRRTAGRAPASCRGSGAQPQVDAGAGAPGGEGGVGGPGPRSDGAEARNPKAAGRSWEAMIRCSAPRSHRAGSRSSIGTSIRNGRPSSAPLRSAASSSWRSVALVASTPFASARATKSTPVNLTAGSWLRWWPRFWYSSISPLVSLLTTTVTIGQVEPRDGLQVRAVGVEAAVARDEEGGLAGTGELGAHGGGDAVAEAGAAGRGEEAEGLVGAGEQHAVVPEEADVRDDRALAAARRPPP